MCLAIDGRLTKTSAPVFGAGFAAGLSRGRLGWGGDERMEIVRGLFGGGGCVHCFATCGGGFLVGDGTEGGGYNNCSRGGKVALLRQAAIEDDIFVPLPCENLRGLFYYVSLPFFFFLFLSFF